MSVAILLNMVCTNSINKHWFR